MKLPARLLAVAFCITATPISVQYISLNPSSLYYVTDGSILSQHQQELSFYG